MKNLWFALIAVLLISCGEKPKISENIMVGGEIRNDEIGYFTLEKTPTPYEVAIGKTYPIDTVKIDTSWLFVQEIVGPKGVYNLTYGDEHFQVYLEPTKKLNINFDGTDVLNTTEFSSDSKKPTRYVVKISKGKQKTPPSTLFALSEEDFLFSVDSMRKSFDTAIVEFITDKPRFDKQFLKEESLSHLYGTYVQMLNYARIRHHYNDTLEDLSEGYFDFKKEINLNDTNALNVSNYLMAIQLLMEDDLEEIAIQEITTFEQYTSAKFHWIDSNLRVQELRDYFYTSALKNYVKYDFHAEPDSIIQLGLTQINDSALAASITSELDTRAHLATGKPAPNFTAIDTAGKEHQLSDLKGKVVYIDFWATWCGPCKQEAPYLEKLRKSMEGENVVILSVSIDDYRGEWQKYISEKEVEGDQWYVKGWKSDAAQQYVIKSIPRFVLIDQQGNIVEANASRPSTKDAKEAIEQLLEPNA